MRPQRYTNSVVHSCNIIDGNDWDQAVEAAKKMFRYEKKVFGQEMILLRAMTGVTNRIMTIGFFESQEAHDDCAQKEREDPKFKGLFDEAATLAQDVLRTPLETDFYCVID